MRRATPFLAALAAIVAIFLVLQYLVDFVSDDFPIAKSIPSFGDIPALIWRTYNEWDGRIGGYLINHTLLFLPKAATVCILALSITALIALISIHALGGNRKNDLSWQHPLCAFCLLWLSMPSFGQVFFWRTGSIYGMLCVFLLLFLLPYRDLMEKRETPSWPLALCVLLGALIGLSDYNASIVLTVLAVSAGLFACVRDRRFRLLPFLPPLAMLAGFFMIFTAPGNAIRVTTEKVAGLGRWEGVLEHLKNQPEVQMYYFWPYLLLAVSLVLLWTLARSRRGKADGGHRGLRPRLTRLVAFLFEERPLLYALAFFLAAQAAQAAFFFAPFASKRAYTSSVLFMDVAALTLFFYVWPQCRGIAGRWLAKLYWGCAFAVFLVTLGNAGAMFYANKHYNDACEAAALAAAPGSVCFPPGPYRSDAYLFGGRSMQPGDNPKYWVNTGYAAYYGVASVRLCPQQFTLVPEAGDVNFQGEVRDSVLRFTYAPAEAGKGGRFVFAFLPAPRNPLRDAFERIVQDYLGDSRIFRKSVANRYDKVAPELASSEGGVLAGSAALPHVEHTDKAYILHYAGGGKQVADVIPLKIVRKN